MEDPQISGGGVSPSSSSTVTDGPCSGVGAVAAPQCSAMSLYYVNLAGARRSITVAWWKTLINHSLTVSVDTSAGGVASTLACRVDLKPWPFWGKKGLKSLDLDGSRVYIFWDLRSAKFSAGAPAPKASYYVAIVCDDEVVLLVGDRKKDAYKRTKCRPSLEDPTLVCKRENVVGKKCFAVRTMFDERKKEHNILVETTPINARGSEMWISIDGVVAVHVDNLRWKFRGNETVIVDQSPLQVFWDVHDWLYTNDGSGGAHALFIFKPGSPPLPPAEETQPVSPDDSERVQESTECLHVALPPWGGASPEFAFFLHAWKME